MWEASAHFHSVPQTTLWWWSRYSGTPVHLFEDVPTEARELQEMQNTWCSRLRLRTAATGLPHWPWQSTACPLCQKAAQGDSSGARWLGVLRHAVECTPCGPRLLCVCVCSPREWLTQFGVAFGWWAFTSRSSEVQLPQYLPCPLFQSAKSREAVPCSMP